MSAASALLAYKGRIVDRPHRTRWPVPWASQEIREAAVNAIIGNVFKEAWWLHQHQQQQRQLRQNSQTPGSAGTDGAADGEEELQLEGIDDHVAMLRGEVSDESSLLLVKWNLLSPSQQVALELSVAQQRFPGAWWTKPPRENGAVVLTAYRCAAAVSTSRRLAGCAVETWTTNDDEAAVYGWPTKGLWLTTVQESNGPLHLSTARCHGGRRGRHTQLICRASHASGAKSQ